jgi:hypothetical protein
MTAMTGSAISARRTQGDCEDQAIAGRFPIGEERRLADDGRHSLTADSA